MSDVKVAYAKYRSAASDLVSIPWRVGRAEPSNVYARTSDDVDGRFDHQIGQFHTAELAAEAVRAHNEALEAKA